MGTEIGLWLKTYFFGLNCV